MDLLNGPLNFHLGVEDLSIVSLTPDLFREKGKAFFDLTELIETDIPFTFDKDIIELSKNREKFDPRLSFAILDKSGNPVAFFISSKSHHRKNEDDIIYLSRMAVVPRYQGTGVAQLFLLVAFKNAFDNGYFRAHFITIKGKVWEKDKKTRAMRFYENIGAIVIGEIPSRPGAVIPDMIHVHYEVSLLEAIHKLNKILESKFSVKMLFLNGVYHIREAIEVSL